MRPSFDTSIVTLTGTLAGGELHINLVDEMNVAATSPDDPNRQVGLTLKKRSP